MVKKWKEDSIPAEILPNLYLGSVGAAMSKDYLKDKGITHILTCAMGISPMFPTEFTYKVLNMLDKPTQSLLSFIEEGSEFIN